MRFIPTVSLHGSGESVTLSNYASEFLLMQGASGLGMGPREISTVALPSGGSLVRHRRTTEATVQLPILLGGSERARWDLRRKLERLVRGEVEIRVTRPNGVSRSLFGFYKQGLEGKYGAGEDSPNGQKLVLDFLCPDPLWKGEEIGPIFQLQGLRKKFLSERAQPVPTGRKNYVVNPSFEASASGVFSAGVYSLSNPQSSAAVAGSRVLEAKVATAPTAGNVYVYLGQYLDPSAIQVGKWVAARVRMRWVSGSKFLRFRMNYTGNSPWGGEVVDGSDGQWHEFTVAAQITSGTTRIAPAGYVADDAAWTVPPVVGTTIQQDGFIACVANTEAEALAAVAEYRDGDSPSWGWSGEPHNSVSVEYVKESTYQSPFLPIVLASSTVQGEFNVSIAGDAPAYPTWIIDGPGSDLIIESNKGKSIKVLGEIADQVTITTNPLRQDITSPSKPNGELWENVPTDSDFFPLEPGSQKIKISMVGAKPNSIVRCIYREQFEAGW